MTADSDLTRLLRSAAATRPRFLFTPERLDRLRARLGADARERSRWDKLRARGKELLEMPWPSAALSKDPFVNYRQPARHLAETVRTLGLLHLIEPDECYAEKLRDGLLHYATGYPPYQQWCAPGFRQSKHPWRSELMTANLCFSHAAALQILDGWLAADERSTLVETLIQRGVLPLLQDWILPGTRLHCLDSMGHNWWLVCASMAGIGALAVLNDHPDAASWVAQIERAIPLWFGYGGSVLQNRVGNFDSAGGYFEGVHYADYALTDYLLFRTALKDVLPGYEPETPAALRNAPHFFLHTFYPTEEGALIVNFGDTQKNAAATMAMRLLVENNFAGNEGRWYVERAAEDSSTPLALLFGCGHSPTPPPGLPVSALFPGASWAALRSGWGDHDTLLAVRAGTYWIHAHADSGSFVLFHGGRPLIIDPGHCEYAEPQYTEYYAASAAHNVVLINGQGAPPEDFVRGSKFPGRILSLLDGGPLKHVGADATGPLAHLAKRHYRHWIWANGAIVIFDDLLAHEPARFSWLLHYAGDALWNAKGAEIRNGAAAADLQFLHPANLEARDIDAPAQDTVAERAPYLEFSTCEPNRRGNFLAVIRPQPRDGTAPEIEPINIPDAIGVRILGLSETTNVYFNLLADGRDSCINPHAVFEGWETDAALLAVTRPAGEPTAPSRLLMVDGSYLRRDGVTWVDSLSRVHCILTFEPGRLRVEIDGQREIELLCHCSSEPREVQVNGNAVPFDFHPEDSTVRCRIRRSLA